jgi:hypothetical protein
MWRVLHSGAGNNGKKDALCSTIVAFCCPLFNLANIAGAVYKIVRLIQQKRFLGLNQTATLGAPMHIKWWYIERVEDSCDTKNYIGRAVLLEEVHCACAWKCIILRGACGVSGRCVCY